jgi:hypothetical protein
MDSTAVIENICKNFAEHIIEDPQISGALRHMALTGATNVCFARDMGGYNKICYVTMYDDNMIVSKWVPIRKRDMISPNDTHEPHNIIRTSMGDPDLVEKVNSALQLLLCD